MQFASAGRSAAFAIPADGHRFLPHPPPAALRLRRSERDEGGGAGAGRGHRRPRHGQSRRRAAAACHRQAVRGRRASPTPTAIRRSRGIPGLRKAQAAITGAASASTLDPDKRSDRHSGLEGGARQPRPGDHRAGRRRARAQPVLPDPHLRLHHRRRRDPLDPGRARRRTSSRRLERAMRFTVPRPKVLVVGYPSNPTAYVADLAFYERLVAFAREHDLIVISDLAYAEIYFGDTPTPSILQVDGAKEVAVEFTSMSKTYSMAGWRIGFAVGNRAADRRAGAGQILSRLRRLHADPGRRRAPRSTARRTSSRPTASSTRSAATCWSKASAAPAGTSRRRRRACSPGRRSPSSSASSARWSSPSAC